MKLTNVVTKTTHVVLITLAAIAVVAATASLRADATSASGLVEDVRRGTRAFHDPAAARAAGYAPFLGCVTGPNEGAMGIHFVNATLVGDGVLDAQHPEALMYEPKAGQLEFIGVEYIVLADAWNAANQTPPVLNGQVFHYTAAPNRYGIPAFYSLHVWAWKQNPNGVFVDWNPKVSCAGSSEAGHHGGHR
jgi:hypothetical protein